MRIPLLLLICLVIQNISLAQKTEIEYVKDVKYLYVRGGNFEEEAKEKVKEGLKKHPNSKGLLRLKELLRVEIDSGTPSPSPQIIEKKQVSKVRREDENGISEITDLVIKKINVDLAMPSQNQFVWNKRLAEEGLKLTLFITTGSGHTFQKDVTGLDSFKFKTGDTRFDGVKCTIKLVIENADGIVVQGTQEINVKTTC